MDKLIEGNFILKQIEEFEQSQDRAFMIKGKDYYNNKTDVKYIKKYRYEGDSQVIDTDKPNNQIAHGFMKLLVDEKVNYLLGKPLVIEHKDKKIVDLIQSIINADFLDILNDVSTEASNTGIGWLHIFINEKGELEFINIDSEQVIPLWKNKNKKELDGVIRYYYDYVYTNSDKKAILKVEHWDRNGVNYYVKDGGMLVEDIEATNENGNFHIVTEGGGEGWGIVPFIPFKNNSNLNSDLLYVKDLIDEYDKRTSETSNTLDEIQELIYVLKNYGGTDLARFMKDLKHYKAIKVDEDGGVDVLKAEINIEAIEKHLDRVKSDFYHFGQGVDMDVDKFGNNPSGVALEFIYSRLKLKVASMERKYQASMRLLMIFIIKYLKLKENVDIDINDIKITFNKTIITNDLDSIESCSKSSSIISNKTILANHPWVDNVAEELKRLEEEKEVLTFVNELNMNLEEEEEEEKEGEEEI